jgi:hypothetical protein
MEKKQDQPCIKPGSKVTCSLHPDWGAGSCTAVVHEGTVCFVVWGEFGKMNDRKYDVVGVNTLKVIKDGTIKEIS